MSDFGDVIKGTDSSPRMGDAPPPQPRVGSALSDKLVGVSFQIHKRVKKASDLTGGCKQRAQCAVFSRFGGGLNQAE